MIWKFLFLAIGFALGAMSAPQQPNPWLDDPGGYTIIITIEPFSEPAWSI